MSTQSQVDTPSRSGTRAHNHRLTSVLLVAAGAGAACAVIGSARLMPNAFSNDGRLFLWFAGFALAAVVAGAVLRAKLRQTTGVAGKAAKIAIGALLVDGLAVGFAPAVYGQHDTSLPGLAALLLWGVGVMLVGAHIAESPK